MSILLHDICHEVTRLDSKVALKPDLILCTFRQDLMYYRVEDAGTYTCIAESDAGKASIDLNLIVYGRPSYSLNFKI